ncbi:hypothetical protein ACJ73_06358 [Blastomyces percursus]|uniref:Uncharacterized protein n=1 Tax=Blastomyces percursus TaxID=1658174 RepID=A0A1J9Q193_9EURO|nr:hypothetical protein ACJ73_06358 [Blastomyces percursus]
MESNSQASPDVETTIQSSCHSPASDKSTGSPIVSACSSSQQSRVVTPPRTCEAPEDADGGQQPATPPTSEPWLWKCPKCYEKFSLGATNRCLYDGHYFYPSFQLKRDRRCNKRQDCKNYAGMLDYTSWGKNEGLAETMEAETSYSLSSSGEGDAKDKVRADSKRARSKITDVPPEASPAKR